jgi:hypothetical protein
MVLEKLVSIEFENEFDKNFTIATLTELSQFNRSEISLDDSIRSSQNYVMSNGLDLENSGVIGSEDKNFVPDNFADESNKNLSLESSSTQQITNPLYSMQLLPENATVWELLIAQVKADFAPFLILVPAPIKKYIKSQTALFFQSMKEIFHGATSSWIFPFRKSIKFIKFKIGIFLITMGDFLIYISKKYLVDISHPLDIKESITSQIDSQRNHAIEAGSDVNNIHDDGLVDDVDTIYEEIIEI